MPSEVCPRCGALMISCRCQHPPRFPLDDATLVMLRSACEINPDNGQTNLHAFLEMGTREKSRTEITDHFEDSDSIFGGAPVFEVEYEEGYEPFGEHDVIVALVDEVFRLRAEAAR